MEDCLDRCTYREGAGSSRLGIEIMASVLHDKTEVQISCEIQGKLNLSDVAHVDRVRGIRPQGAVGVIREDVWGEAS